MSHMAVHGGLRVPARSYSRFSCKNYKVVRKRGKKKKKMGPYPPADELSRIFALQSFVHFETKQL